VLCIDIRSHNVVRVTSGDLRKDAETFNTRHVELLKWVNRRFECTLPRALTVPQKMEKFRRIVACHDEEAEGSGESNRKERRMTRKRRTKRRGRGRRQGKGREKAKIEKAKTRWNARTRQKSRSVRGMKSLEPGDWSGWWSAGSYYTRAIGPLRRGWS
jgi:hypothetical protein